MEAAAPAAHDRSQYQGKKLLLLLIALFGPAFVLFLKMVCGIAGSAQRVTASQLRWLSLSSYTILALFLLLQIVCARYVQRLLPPASSRIAEAAQYAGVLLVCLFISYCGAVSCEAFGYVVFLRLAQP